MSDITGDMLSEVLDAIVGAGGDDVVVNSFMLSASTEVYAEASNRARQAAVEDAQSVAELLAASAGVTVGDIMQITDNNMTPRSADAGRALGGMEGALLLHGRSGTGKVWRLIIRIW